MTYHIGQTLPLTTIPAFGAAQAPQWFILLAKPQCDERLAVKLERLGAADAWRPTKTAWKPARGARKRIEYEQAVAPGYVFMLVDSEPHWHLIAERCRNFLRGVVCVNSRPYAVPAEKMAQMAKVPERIETLRKQAEARRAAERLAKQPQVGQRAKLLEGPLAGLVVRVEGIDKGIASFLLNGIKGRAQIETLERQDTKA